MAEGGEAELKLELTPPETHFRKRCFVFPISAAIGLSNANGVGLVPNRLVLLRPPDGLGSGTVDPYPANFFQFPVIARIDDFIILMGIDV